MKKNKKLGTATGNLQRQKKRKRIKGAAAIGAGALLIGAMVISGIQSAMNPPERITYTQYQEYLDDGKIDIIKYDPNSQYMTVFIGDESTAKLTDAQKESHPYPDESVFKVQFPDNEDFRKEMLEKGIVLINSADENDIVTFLDRYAGLIIYAVLFGLLFYALKKNNPMSATGFAKLVASDDIDVDFDKIIGLEEIKADLQLLVKQMKDGKNARDLSHGILFEGGAGTGKTMLAKAVAHEAGLNFISVNSSNLVEMYVGLGARRVREAFKQARAAAPCVLFFDELDAVGAQRGSQRSHRENDQTINALLTEMDGFQTTDGVFVIAATNRASDLDDALVRSGRFDRKVTIEAPKDWETRQKMFDHNLSDAAGEDVNTEILAKQVIGFSGADIAAVVREAKLLSYRDENEKVTQDELEEAIDKIVFKGNRSNKKQNAEDAKIVAYHEAGHAIGHIVTGTEVSRISVRGMTSGVGGAVFAMDNDRTFSSRSEIENTIIVTYAGRAAEEVFFGRDNITQGASNDITQATALLYDYVAKYGFDSQFGLVDFSVLAKNGVITTEKTVTERISALSNELYNKTVRLMQEHKEEIKALAEKLIEVKTLDGNEVTELLQNVSKL